jgi:hypothetical protein
MICAFKGRGNRGKSLSQLLMKNGIGNISLIGAMRFAIKLLCLLSLPLLTTTKVQAQQETNYSIHANIIYRFTKYIDWPADKKTGDFVIGIVGDSPLHDVLKSFVANKMVGSQRIVIKKFSPSAPEFNCQILFICEEESGSLKKIAFRTAGASILLVSEKDGLASKGSCINFIIVLDHLKLEINKTNIEQRNLRVATELLSLGLVVR